MSEVDEVIMVDTGSTDGTVEIIQEYEHRNPGIMKLYHYTPDRIFHYGMAKNVALAHATKSYIIILDSDEVPEAGFFQELRVFLKKYCPDVATIARKDDLLPHFIEQQTRIVRNNRGIFYAEDETGRLHECLQYEGPIAHFPGSIIHKQGKHHWLVSQKHADAQMQLEIARTPKTKSFIGHILRGVWSFQYKFRKVYLGQGLYKDGLLGLHFAWLKARYAFLVQYYVGLKLRQ